MPKYVPGKYYTGKPCKAGHLAERLIYNGQCVECKKLTDRKSNIKATKKYQLRAHYGLTEQDVGTLFTLQQGLCAICCRPLAPRHGTQIDHCHTTGKVRGLLCNHCNRLLGCAFDNIDILQNAIKYLEK